VQPDGPKRLPEANEFSPGQIELRDVLKLADENAGSRAAIVEAIRARYFPQAAATRAKAAERLEQTNQANNVVIGMKGYALFDLDTNVLTPVGKALLATPDDATLRAEFGEHILKSCHGIEVLEAVRAIQTRNETATKALLQTELETRGFRLPRATTHHTKLLQWLRDAGVVDSNNNVDEEAVARLTGVGLETLEEWSGLTREQRAFLRTLRRLGDIHGTDRLAAKDVLTQSKFEHGAIFREDQLAARVFKPLEEQGWVKRQVGAGGRGGKSGLLAATPKLLALDLDVLPADEDWGIPAELRPRLNTPLADIQKELASSNTHTKGIALELLALRLATDSGLTPLRFRLRADETGGGEVDLIAEGVHLHFSRWLFQCKNTRTVALSDLAKEVGMAVLLRAHVIVMVTTGRFAGSVQRYAKELMDTQPFQVILIDSEVLDRYRDGGLRSLMDFLRSDAEAAMRLKRGQIERHVASGDV
jgi:Restriction endonuclease